jgi:hypothetical protein
MEIGGSIKQSHSNLTLIQLHFNFIVGYLDYEKINIVDLPLGFYLGLLAYYPI